MDPLLLALSAISPLEEILVVWLWGKYRVLVLIAIAVYFVFFYKRKKK